MRTAALALSLLLPVASAAAQTSPFAIAVGSGVNDVRGLPLSGKEAERTYGRLSPNSLTQVKQSSDRFFDYVSGRKKEWNGPALNTSRMECAPDPSGRFQRCNMHFGPVDVPALRKMLSGATVYDPYSLGHKDGQEFAVEMIQARSGAGREGAFVALAFVLSGDKVSAMVVNPEPWIQVARTAPPPAPISTVTN